MNVLFSSVLWPWCVRVSDDPQSNPRLPRKADFSAYTSTGSLHRWIARRSEEGVQ